DLDLVIQWIDAGAPEAVNGATTASATTAPAATEPAAGGPNWETDIQVLFAEKCVACHGSMGGLSLETYKSAMEGGENGPVILPGDAEASMLVQGQREGGHLGQFTDEELDLIISWINAGALE
ncbi:MAG: hypothetical protein MUO76_02635, partial [Anaerolineaceae bacterium]|nr:hypothetical protein [Anaerolineaceae bacterium]